VLAGVRWLSVSDRALGQYSPCIRWACARASNDFQRLLAQFRVSFSAAVLLRSTVSKEKEKRRW